MARRTYVQIPYDERGKPRLRVGVEMAGSSYGTFPMEWTKQALPNGGDARKARQAVTRSGFWSVPA